MIDNNIIFNNPLIQPGYYYAKLIDVETEPSDYQYPKILATLKLHQMYNLAPNDVFHGIIHPTQHSLFHYKNFRNAFCLGRSIDEIGAGVGQWGSIEIYTSEFNDAEYSAVKFVFQPIPVRMECWRIWREENEDDSTHD